VLFLGVLGIVILGDIWTWIGTGAALVVVAAAVGAGCASSADDEPTTSAVAARVGDGDTLDLRSGERVRLVQIDAPELGEGECYARAARAELLRLVPPGTPVGLERDARLDDVDGYGRLLRYVVVQQANVNVELVRLGAAAPYFFRGERGRLGDRLLDAAAEARRSRRGMWGACRVSWRADAPLATHPR
jgi:micrococcal nuclease